MSDYEYANFGLPGDAANQPGRPPQPASTSPPRPRGWFSRNLWWVLPSAVVAMVLPCGCCGGIFYWVISAMKSSEPYQIALRRVRTNREVIENLGQPIQESSWAPSGNISTRTNNGAASGEATFDFNVAGPKGAAHVRAEAHCRSGRWAFSVLDVTPASTGKTISLAADGNAGMGAEADGAARKEPVP